MLIDSITNETNVKLGLIHDDLTHLMLTLLIRNMHDAGLITKENYINVLKKEYGVISDEIQRRAGGANGNETTL